MSFGAGQGAAVDIAGSFPSNPVLTSATIGTLSVTASETVGTTLNVTGAATLGSAVVTAGETVGTTLAVTGTTTVTGGLIGTAPAPGLGRGFIVLLGKLVGLPLNAVAATTIFTTPGAGFTRCVITSVVIDNFSAVASTASVSYGASATPTDWAATATMPGATAAGKFIQLLGGAAASGSATYGTGIAFVANVTIIQGVATTADVAAYGYFE
jgi:hypothetical protein